MYIGTLECHILSPDTGEYFVQVVMPIIERALYQLSYLHKPLQIATATRQGSAP